MKGPIGLRKKKLNVYANNLHKHSIFLLFYYFLLLSQGKKQRHTMCKFVFREINFYQLVDSSVMVYFTVTFQTKAEKPLCFLITLLSR